MATKVLNVDTVGTVAFTRRKGSKRISMRVKSDGIVSVNYPWFASEKEVVNFLLNNTDWIKKQQQKLQQHKTIFHIGETFQTKLHEIQIVEITEGELKAVLKGSKVVVTVPKSLLIENDDIQQYIRKIIIEICRKEAKMYLPARVKQLADIHGFQYEKVFIKNLKSKWGSCSSKGNINLNVHLMLLPDYLIDYIILHELSHTVEMNHSPAFWNVLDRVTNGMAKPWDKEMKQHSSRILQ